MKSLARIAAVGLLALAPACTGRDDAPRSLLLVTIDTLRADHLGCYGYARDTTPNLDALAARGVRFERVLAPVGRTTQSLATILTGKGIAAHGVHALTDSLAADNVTLAERFTAAGAHAGAVVALPFFAPERYQGLDQGFERGFELMAGEFRAEAVVDKALAWLDQHGDAPFFLWVHLRDPHAPYYPPREFRDRFDPDYDGEYEDYYHYWPVGPDQRPLGPISGPQFERKARVKFGVDRLAPRDLERAIALYDGDIAYTDSQVGRLLDGLAALGIAGDTAVAVTADHGESFGEHGVFFDHGETVFDSCLRVPLIVHVPGSSAPTLVEDQVGLVDVAPSLVALFGLEPLEGIQGLSFDAALSGGTIRPRALFAESGEPVFWEQNPRFRGRTDPPRDPCDRLRAFCASDGRKVVFDPVAPDERQIALFDAVADPGEADDRAADPAAQDAIEKGGALLRLIRDLACGVDLPDDVPDDQRSRLEEQGYLGGTQRNGRKQRCAARSCTAAPCGAGRPRRSSRASSARASRWCACSRSSRAATRGKPTA